MEEMTAQLKGAVVEDSSDDEESGDDEPAVRGGVAPPPYAELSSHFGALETAAEGSGNHEAAFHLQKAKMAMIAAHASKPARQADMRELM